MRDMEIGRLALHVPGLHPDAAPRLAKLVAEGLGRGVLPESFSAERLQVGITSGVHGTSLEQLANQIVRELLRHIGS